MYIHKAATARYSLSKNCQFYDQELLCDPEVAASLEQKLTEMEAIQAWLDGMYTFLRQGARAAAKQLEVPECLKQKQVPTLAAAVAELSHDAQEQQQDEQDSEVNLNEE